MFILGSTNTLTQQDKVNADKAAAMMQQQGIILENLKVIIDICEKNKFLDNVTPKELQGLKDYCSGMSLAIETFYKLSQNLIKAYKEYLNEKKSGKVKKKNIEAETDLSRFFDE